MDLKVAASMIPFIIPVLFVFGAFNRYSTRIQGIAAWLGLALAVIWLCGTIVLFW